MEEHDERHAIDVFEKFTLSPVYKYRTVTASQSDFGSAVT